MQDKAARIANIGQMRKQLHILDQANARLKIAFHAKGENRTRPFRQIALGECIKGAIRQASIGHPGDFRMVRQEFRHLLGIGNMAFHAHMQCLNPGDGQPGIHGRKRGAKITQRHGARFGREGKIAEILVKFQPMISGFRVRHAWEFAIGVIELARFNDHAAQRIAMPAEKLRQRMGDDIRAMFEGPAQIR
ncbi:MAG: hypothetical protein ING12_08720 [Roseomonas sp.]|nr:hypothetical protein [Roseomonas sp.]